jgi:hypothetical protein
MPILYNLFDNASKKYTKDVAIVVEDKRKLTYFESHFFDRGYYLACLRK